MHPIQTILVPRGAEYQAVARGLRGAERPTLIAIPMGMVAVSKALAERQDLSQSQILVMGLCGSLRSDFQIGDAVLYQSTISPTGRTQLCNAQLTANLQAYLPQIPLVQSVTSTQFLQSVAAKQQLGQIHQAGAVDMEGSAILTALPQAQIAMLRVISDDCEHELPDLTPAIDRGHVKTLPLITTLLQHPIGSLRLIRGSLRGLTVLEQLTRQLFQT